MNESEASKERIPTPRPVRDIHELDWRRLEVASHRFSQSIASGIEQARTADTDIDLTTARCIAHVLGRAWGRNSALADFGRTGEGEYLSLRDEYLEIYYDERVDASTKEMVDWLGTYLVQREGTGSGRTLMNEHLPPRLDQLLVRTNLRVGGEKFVVSVPASWHSGHEDELIERLTSMQLSANKALQAYLSLPNVSAATPNIMETFSKTFVGTFETDEHALRALSPLEDWETSLADWCIENGVDFESLEWQYAPLMERLRGVFDIVESEGQLYAFFT